MKSYTRKSFWTAYHALPEDVRRQARKAYRLFKDNPSHPSLNFKRIHNQHPYYAVRVTRDYRALGLIVDNDMVWFWIGSHADYDKFIKRL